MKLLIWIQTPEQPPKKRGRYRSYSLQLKMSVVEEVCEKPISIVAEKYNVPRSTILSWENELRMKNKECPATFRGIHLRLRSG